MKKEQKGYEKKKATLQELIDKKLTKETSINALRARARAGILIYLENSGPTQYYDEQLSAIRSKAASDCKRPGVFWKDLERAFKAGDASNAVNALIIKNLDSGLSQQTVVEAVAKVIKQKLEA